MTIDHNKKYDKLFTEVYVVHAARRRDFLTRKDAMVSKKRKERTRQILYIIQTIGFLISMYSSRAAL